MSPGHTAIRTNQEEAGTGPRCPNSTSPKERERVGHPPPRGSCQNRKESHSVAACRVQQRRNMAKPLPPPPSPPVTTHRIGSDAALLWLGSEAGRKNLATSASTSLHTVLRWHPQEGAVPLSRRGTEMLQPRPGSKRQPGPSSPAAVQLGAAPGGAGCRRGDTEPER